MSSYDVVVIGSGFGGSVAALRLSEKGYRVAVLEAGRRFTDETLPKTSWDLRNFLWAPKLGMRGIQRIHVLDDVVVLAGAGVGGGSLVYANTLYEPLDAFYEDGQWAHITDWKSELAPYYGQASRMLGVVTNPTVSPSDEAMRDVAEQMGVGSSFRLTPVGVFFGRDGDKQPGELVADPYFGGAGPDRRGCIECGECMIGCRHGAKNRLDRNYLALAEGLGAQVHPDTTVSSVRPLPAGGYAVDTVRTGRWRTRRPDATFTAEQVVFAAGTYGTQQLLFELRDTGVLPRISVRLGELTRTNSEALLGAKSRSKDADYTRGVAITSSFHPDGHTHIEPVRYGKGSNAMGLLSTLMMDGDGRYPRWLALLATMLAHPMQAARGLSVRRWSEKTIIVLVMQSLDNSLTTFRTRRRLGGHRLASRQGHGAPNPSWIPVGHEATKKLADRIGGDPGGTWGEVFNIPMTAHFIGGCPIGDSPDSGVIDPYQRLYGHPGLHVVDGSALSANLGVNPSLSITAQAERAMALWPNKGEVDPRPPLGAAYRTVTPVRPVRPAVPAGAPGGAKAGRLDARALCDGAVKSGPRAARALTIGIGFVLLVGLAGPAAATTSGPGVAPGQIRALDGATQAVVVTASSWGDTRAVLNAWVRSGGSWHLVMGSVPAYAGYAGFSAHRHEGDGTTPAGVFGFVYGFGSQGDPGSAIGWRALVPHSCWAGTRASYNRWVTRNPCASQDEDLWRSAGGAYRYAAVVDYNYAHPVYGAGSGIFVHVSLGHPTSGCISIPQSNMVRLLRWLRPGTRIAMGPASYLRSR